MKWVTRSEIHVDRAASAWLIATYVDPDATFVYVDDVNELPEDATAFDIRGCDLSHVGEDVTFETVLRTYDLHDPVLWQIAEIVHQADVEDDKFEAPAADGLDILIRAISADHTDEQTRLLVGELLTSLERYLRQQAIS